MKTIDVRQHCCETMTHALNSECEQHPDVFGCPDALVHYAPKFDEYGLIIHDGGMSTSSIGFCPWCGTKLPQSKRDLWFDELEKLGYSDPSDPNIPERFQSDIWWRDQ